MNLIQNSNCFFKEFAITNEIVNFFWHYARDFPELPEKQCVCGDFIIRKQCSKYAIILIMISSSAKRDSMKDDAKMC